MDEVQVTRKRAQVCKRKSPHQPGCGPGFFCRGKKQALTEVSGSPRRASPG